MTLHSGLFIWSALGGIVFFFIRRERRRSRAYFALRDIARLRRPSRMDLNQIGDHHSIILFELICEHLGIVEEPQDMAFTPITGLSYMMSSKNPLEALVSCLQTTKS